MKVGLCEHTEETLVVSPLGFINEKEGRKTCCFVLDRTTKRLHEMRRCISPTDISVIDALLLHSDRTPFAL